MEIYCKKCDKVLGNYPEKKIPLNIKGHTTCNLCSSRIELFRTEETSSTNNITEMPEAPVDDPSVPDDIAKTIPILSGRRDRGSPFPGFRSTNGASRCRVLCRSTIGG